LRLGQPRQRAGSELKKNSWGNHARLAVVRGRSRALPGGRARARLADTEWSPTDKSPSHAQRRYRATHDVARRLFWPGHAGSSRDTLSMPTCDAEWHWAARGRAWHVVYHRRYLLRQSIGRSAIDTPTVKSYRRWKSIAGAIGDQRGGNQWSGQRHVSSRSPSGSRSIPTPAPIWP